jgi:hypothetical protein
MREFKVYLLMDDVTKKFYTNSYTLVDNGSMGIYYNESLAEKVRDLNSDHWKRACESTDIRVQSEVKLRSSLRWWGIKIVPAVITIS